MRRLAKPSFFGSSAARWTPQGSLAPGSKTTESARGLLQRADFVHEVGQQNILPNAQAALDRARKIGATFIGAVWAPSGIHHLSIDEIPGIRISQRGKLSVGQCD